MENKQTLIVPVLPALLCTGSARTIDKTLNNSNARLPS